MARSTGFEPAISSVTGRRDNPFTTSAWAFSASNMIAVFTSEVQQGRRLIFLR